MERLPCGKCGVLILEATHKKNKGLCAPCTNGFEKKMCRGCQKEFLSPSVEGLCMSCLMTKSQFSRDRWAEICRPQNNMLDIEILEIKPYPDFKDVFINEKLEGFFYPLCSVKYKNKQTQANIILHLVSYSGLWIDEEKFSKALNNDYIRFQISDGKYDFAGDIEAFTGYEYIADLYRFMQSDFEMHIHKYNEGEVTDSVYCQHIQENFGRDISSFDSAYYIRSFYDYNIRKIKYSEIEYSLNIGKLIEENYFIPYDNKDFVGIGEEIILNENYFSFPVGLLDQIPVGVCWVEKYFSDGNNVFLFSNTDQTEAYCINQYS